jgi:hypothetical protein
MSTPTSTASEVASISSEVATAAGVAAPIAAQFGPYGIAAAGALTIIEGLATEAPQVYNIIAKAFDGTPKTHADFEALKTEAAAITVN